MNHRIQCSKTIPAGVELAFEQAVYEKRGQLAKLGIGADADLAKADNTYKIMLLLGGGILGTYFMVNNAVLTGLAVLGGTLAVGGILEQSGKI